MTMRRLNINSLATRAISTAAVLLGLSMPALAATTAHKTHRPAIKTASSETAKTPALASAVSVKTASKHTAPPAHTQSVSAARRRRARAASAKTQATAHAAPVPRPSQADFDAAARVHAWEASQHSAGTDTAAAAVVPAATQPAAPIVHKATSADFIRASQPQASNVLPDEAPAPDSAATPAPAPAGVEAQASPKTTPVAVPLVYNRRGRLVMPAALKGSHDILVHQNEMADSEGLDRIQDDADLANKIAAGQLVRIPVSPMLRVDERLPDNRRYCRPWVAKFLTDISRAHYARFHTPLQVNSAVRTVEFQDRLRRTNGNAAPSEGDTASPHLTGFAVDIAKKPLSHTEVAWMRGYLLPLEQQGKIDVEEEFQQACFHMSVYRKYVPGTPGAPRSQPASSTTNMLATSLR
jgi:hypothetical protein